MFDAFDQMLRSYQNDASADSVLPPSTAQAQAQAATTSPLDQMLNTAKAPPQLPQADLSQLLPLTLLNFAANVTQPRQRGQGTLGKVLEATAGAATYNMNTKKQLEDRATEQELNRRKFAATDEALKGARLSNVKTEEDIRYSEQTRPLELQALQQRISSAKTEAELHALELRMGKVKEKYQAQEIQAGLDEKAAKTDEQRAQAAMERSHARFYQTQADEFIHAIQERRAGANKPDYQLREGLPGEPSTVLDKRTGTTYLAPMSPADSLDYAKRQIAARKEVGEFPDKTTEKMALQQEYQKALKGNIPAVPATGGAPGPAGAQPSGQPGAPQPAVQQQAEMEPGLKDIMMKTQASPDSTAAYANKDGAIVIVKGGQVQDKVQDRNAFDAKYEITPTGGIKRKGAAAPSNSVPGTPGRVAQKTSIVGPTGLPLNPADMPPVRAMPGARPQVSFDFGGGQ